MNLRLLSGLVCVLSSLPQWLPAQSADQNLAPEVAAVRAEIGRSLVALRQYTWTEQVEVLHKGDIKSTTTSKCFYDPSGRLIKVPTTEPGTESKGSVTSNRPLVRKKAEVEDDIERAVGRIHHYFPPNPEQIDAALQRGQVTLAQAKPGEWEARFTNYYEDKDSLVFIYDPVSKVLLRVTAATTLGNPKDRVTLEAVFEKLPDGVNHMSSALLNAKSKKIQVKLRNGMYQKQTQ